MVFAPPHFSASRCLRRVAHATRAKPTNFARSIGTPASRAKRIPQQLTCCGSFALGLAFAFGHAFATMALEFGTGSVIATIDENDD